MLGDIACVRIRRQKEEMREASERSWKEKCDREVRLGSVVPGLLEMEAIGIN